MAGIYQTAGRRRLMEFLECHPDRQYTVDELSDALTAVSPADLLASCPADLSPGRGKSTLYRHLSELCAEGMVRKYRSDVQSAYVYQYVGGGNCCHHFHLKCEVCGRLVHLDCTVSEELLAHIRSDHQFRVDSGRSILYGVCEGCTTAKPPTIE